MGVFNASKQRNNENRINITIRLCTCVYFYSDKLCIFGTNAFSKGDEVSPPQLIRFSFSFVEEKKSVYFKRTIVIFIIYQCFSALVKAIT